ncbi:unnamed protein product [Dovyalis caffra]|uniref:HMA domain-containing protein n=1 Tax=Dovyalis caffra TaxID=77055 RepID=A0AAV1SB48_9ROSI|nr:unnamed protein product [Dovyalis caffra]
MDLPKKPSLILQLKSTLQSQKHQSLLLRDLEKEVGFVQKWNCMSAIEKYPAIFHVGGGNNSRTPLIVTLMRKLERLLELGVDGAHFIPGFQLLLRLHSLVSTGYMAKETEVKKIELKVSVSCCDGCKRKVKKVLQSVEGVLKTEIDPLYPKVTVLGNVNPQILIKRLLKTGKQAELWSSGNQNAGKEKEEADIIVTKEKDKSKFEREPTKSSDSCGKTTDKNREIKNGGDGGENNASKKQCNETDVNVKACNPEVVKRENPASPSPEASNFRTYNQCCYKVEPYAIALPCYAIPSYTVPPVNPAGYGQEYLIYERPLIQPPFQTPTVRVGDYFSDENTLGCNVM